MDWEGQPVQDTTFHEADLEECMTLMTKIKVYRIEETPEATRKALVAEVALEVAPEVALEIVLDEMEVVERLVAD